MGTLLQDLRYGLRILAKNPGFTTVAVITLALGIGASTGMFSAIDGVLLRPLPFPNPNQIMTVLGLTEPRIIDPLVWWGHNHSFDQLASCYSGGINLIGGGQAERTLAAVVSASFFPVLEVRPILGRGFFPDEETPGRNHVAVLSYGLWADVFGKDSGALGGTVRLNGIPHTVVGVMPPGFSFPGHARVWVPRVAPAARFYGQGALDLGSSPSGRPSESWTIGRLRAGVSRTQAEAEMTLLSRRLQEKFGDEQHIVVANKFVNVRPLQEVIVGDVRPALLVLFVAIVFVLLIACANAANMLLARAAVRQKEVAVRLCLGASGRRIVRQLLTESLLLALASGSLGVVFALWIVDAIRAIAPANTPRLEGISVDARVLVFALCVSLLTGVLVGLAPALQSFSPELLKALKEEGHRSTGTIHTLVRSALVIGEVSLALVLLTGAGLMIRSLHHLTHVELGFNPRNVLTVELDLPKARYGPNTETTASTEKPKQQAAKSIRAPEKAKPTLTHYAVFHEHLLGEIRGIPGVVAAGAVNNLLLSDGGGSLYFDVRGVPTGEARFFEIGGDYFRAMEIPLLAGRVFTEKDTGSAPRVVIVSQSLARQVWGSKNPVGDQLLIEGEETPREIVGVVGDVAPVQRRGMMKWQSWNFYLPYLQGYRRSNQGPLDMTIVVRTTSDSRGIIPALKTRVLSVDKDLAVFNVRPMEQVIFEYAAPQRFRGLLLSVFAFLAVLLAGLGVYGVVSYSAAIRTHEIGIRISLGANPRDVLLLILGEGVRRALVGISLGLLLALGLNKLISGLLFGVGPSDPATYIFSAALLFALASAGSYVPARRATKADPMAALRYE